MGKWTIDYEARWNSEGYGVDPTATWDESYRSYPGRPCLVLERATVINRYLEQGVSRRRSIRSFFSRKDRTKEGKSIVVFASDVQQKSLVRRGLMTSGRSGTPRGSHSVELRVDR